MKRELCVANSIEPTLFLPKLLKESCNGKFFCDNMENVFKHCISLSRTVQEQKQQNCPQLQPCLYAKLIAIVPYYNLPNRIQDFLFNFQILLSSMDNLELIISTSNKDTKVVRDALNEIIGSHLVKKIHLVSVRYNF